MSERQSAWSRWAIPLHIAVVVTVSCILARSHSRLVCVALAPLSGVSLFVLTGLVHEASHHLLAGRTWLNEVLGNFAGSVVGTPLTAYRAFHLRHHQTTNRADDPNRPLNSRWMLACGAIAYVALIHLYAWRHLRGRLMVRYLVECAAGVALAAAIFCLIPHGVRDRALLAPLAVVALLQNVRIVSEHLDRPTGKYRDTWQLVLPAWLSGWLLHYDHHLEHHLRPGLPWHELPQYRDELARREPSLGLQRITLIQFFANVFPRRYHGAETVEAAGSSESAGETTTPADAA